MVDKSSILWFLGSHSLDTLRWMFDDEVKRVYSVKRSGLLKELGVDTDDIFLTTIEFKNGGIAHMENGWITPNGNTNINDFKFSILCTEGMISIDASSHNLIHMVTEDRAHTPDILVSNTVFDRCKGFAYESIRDFIDRLIDGREFRVSLRMPKISLGYYRHTRISRNRPACGSGGRIKILSDYNLFKIMSSRGII